MSNSHGLVPINGELHSNTSFHSNGIFLSSSTLGIIYSLVARDSVILAHYACCHGNFSEVVQQVLRTISTERERRLSYASGEYMYHYISEDDDVVYLCITDDEFERSKAFLFLSDIRIRFKDSYSGTIQSALPFAMNNEFSDVLKEEMTLYTTATLNMLPAQKLDNIRVRNLALIGDDQLEQLELLESMDSVSVKSFEALRDPLFKAKCHSWIKQRWKIFATIFIIGFFILAVMVAIALGLCLEGTGSSNTCGR